MGTRARAVSYTHLRAHETPEHIRAIAQAMTNRKPRPFYSEATAEA